MAVSGDPLYRKVIVALHGDGANNSTTFTDSGPLGKVFAGVSGAKISSDRKQFGTGSIALNGSSDYLYLPQDSDFNFGTDDFTLETWLYRTANGNNFATLLGSNPTPFSPPATFWMVFGSQVAGVPDRLAVGTYYNNPIIISDSPLPLNTWTHLAATRSGNTFRLFINGVLDKTVTVSASLDFSASGTRIGSNGWDGGNSFTSGFIDDFRVSRACRYTTTFTPPTETFGDFYQSPPATLLGGEQWVHPGVLPAGFNGVRKLTEPAGIGADAYFGGNDYVAGVLTINEAPRRGFVRLHEQKTGLQVAAKWTDEVGNFRFDRVAQGLAYYVVGFDPVSGEQAVVFDRI